MTPHETALIAVHDATGAAVPDAHVAAAHAAGALWIDVSLNDGDTPWQGSNLPGDGGCVLAPGELPRTVRVRSDRGGVFFVSSIDLVLRASGTRKLLLAGDAPQSFMAHVAQFARLRGYEFERFRANSTGSRAVEEGGHAASDAAGITVPSFEERIAPPHSALVLIDVQNDFCHPKGLSARSSKSTAMIDAAVANIKALLAAARAAGLFIVHVRAEYGPLYRNAGSPYRFPTTGGREPAVWSASAADVAAGYRFPPEAVEVCLPGSWGARFVEGVEPRPGEAVLSKHRFSAFVDTGLDLMLRANGIRNLVIAGVTTNCCVESTARDAAMNDFYLTIASDCVGVKDHLRDLHEASLETMSLYFGLVRPSTDMIEVWRRRNDGALRSA